MNKESEGFRTAQTYWVTNRSRQVTQFQLEATAPKHAQAQPPQKGSAHTQRHTANLRATQTTDHSRHERARRNARVEESGDPLPAFWIQMITPKRTTTTLVISALTKAIPMSLRWYPTIQSILTSDGHSELSVHTSVAPRRWQRMVAKSYGRSLTRCFDKQ